MPSWDRLRRSSGCTGGGGRWRTAAGLEQARNRGRSTALLQLQPLQQVRLLKSWLLFGGGLELLHVVDARREADTGLGSTLLLPRTRNTQEQPDLDL